MTTDLFFYGIDIHRLGEMFLLPDGLVAIVDRQGVYASPPSNKDSVLAFQGSENLGGANSIPITIIRKTLFDEWDIWTRLRNQTEQLIQWVRRVHVSLGYVAYPAWIGLFWILVVLLSLIMWIFIPSYLAWWSMPKAGGNSIFQILFLWMPIFSSVVFLTYWGNTKRALKKWLKRNRKILEQKCFTEHDSVIYREKYYPIDVQNDLHRFEMASKENRRGLVWINGVGGSGKSALAMYILRNVLNGNLTSAIPVFVGQDWHGSLAAQIAQQLRHPDWTRGPTETMVKTLGACGLICPLVDSLSERGGARDMHDIVESVKFAIADYHFRHLIVTSRENQPRDQIWQNMQQITPKLVKRDKIRSFIEVYIHEKESIDIEKIENEISSFFRADLPPNPLFLRFAIEQAIAGLLKIKDIDPITLVLNYVKELSIGNNINREDMMRAAAIAAIQSVYDSLLPKEFSENHLRWALTRESQSMKFYDETGSDGISPRRLVRILINSGLIVEGNNSLQFAHDSVAEYLAVWWVKRGDPMRSFNAFHESIRDSDNTEIGRIYRKI